jgi:hypothetical protein
VLWRGGQRSLGPERRPQSHLRNCRARGPDSRWRAAPKGNRRTHQFEDVSHLLSHRHLDEPFDDFIRQPLLPNKLSQLGPGVSWFDVDGDGWDDLIVPGGKTGQLAVFQNDGKGGFKRLNAPWLQEVITRDQTTVLGFARADGQTVLLAGSANYEDGRATGPGLPKCPQQFFGLPDGQVL